MATQELSSEAFQGRSWSRLVEILEQVCQTGCNLTASSTNGIPPQEPFVARGDPPYDFSKRRLSLSSFPLGNSLSLCRAKRQQLQGFKLFYLKARTIFGSGLFYMCQFARPRRVVERKTVIHGLNIKVSWISKVQAPNLFSL